MVLEVDHGELWAAPVEIVSGPVGLEHPVLRNPVQLAVQRQWVVLDARQDHLPPLEDFAVLGGGLHFLDELLGEIQILPLELEGPDPAAVPQANRAPAGDVPRHLVKSGHWSL